MFGGVFWVYFGLEEGFVCIDVVDVYYMMCVYEESFYWGFLVVGELLEFVFVEIVEWFEVEMCEVMIYF